MKRRPATAEEARALANPLRLRILRLCLDEALTNRQLAVRLGRDPGTVLYHVRVLVHTEFLKAEPPQRGARGSVERPYRATGKSWTVEVGGEDPQSTLSMVDAFRAELADAGPGSVLSSSRLGVRLGHAAVEELIQRLA
ncbi:MAG: winged helix-turn-helix domain-containing protein, partial [Chloroflexi bacterium]|nr:winged helix-turn-helix domain-containing protein [Chloroflexota bacterium]